MSKVTKQGTQGSFEHQGNSIRKLVRDRKTERHQVKQLGLMAKWSLYILPLRVLGTAVRTDHHFSLVMPLGWGE